MKTKVKIYDFDKTLAKGDSIFYLLKFGINKGLYSRSNVLGHLIKAGFKFLKHRSMMDFKNECFKLINIFDERQLNDFVDEHLEERGFKNIIKDINDDDNAVTILCSASPERYIKLISDRLGFDYYLGTRDDGEKLIGFNNAKEEKLRRINELCDKENIMIDYESSIAFTDSYKNDKWMASPCKTKYIVNSKKSYDGYINIEGKNDL
ncbi:MAG: HAD family hydrolase [Ezakiella sp.]|nr:HAD family hydrolase [Ezakiella sp.]